MASIYLDENDWYRLEYVGSDGPITVDLGRSYVGRGPNYYTDGNKLYVMDYSNHLSEVIVYIIFCDGTLVSKNEYEFVDTMKQHRGFLYILYNNYRSKQSSIYKDNVLIWQIDGVIVNPNDFIATNNNISFIVNSDKYVIDDDIVKHV